MTASRWRSTAGVSLVVALASCGGGGATGVRPGPGPNPVPTALDTIRVVDVVEAAVARMPGRGSEGYVVPSGGALADVRDAVEAISAGNVDAARALLDDYGYDVRLAIERASGDTLTLLVERTPVQRGWGTYVFRRGAATLPADIEVNHPVADRNTETIGPVLYEECRCRWLLVAGTDRFANAVRNSDMARETASVFQAIHEEASATTVQAVSVHGFERTNHDDPIASSDQVVSNGSTGAGGVTMATESGLELQARLRDAGFVVGYFPVDPGFSGLGATQNPQGRYSNSTYGHGRWIHIENAAEVRDDPAVWGKMVQVVTAWLEEMAER